MTSVCEHWAYRYNPLMPTTWFAPPTITYDGKEVCMTRKALFGLITKEEHVSIERVASVRINRGIMTAAVTIETMGGAVSDFTMKYLPKKEAANFATTLRADISL